jgi:hypothetical protein
MVSRRQRHRTANRRGHSEVPALGGWISAQISDVHPVRPIARTAAIGVLSMTITYATGHLFRL